MVDNDIRFKQVKCAIEGGSNLHINLLGKCVPMPKEQIQSIPFSTEVRQPTKQKVTLKNPSGTPWKIKANISSSSKQPFFSGPEWLEVGANSQADYEITYNPQTMTSEEGKGREESH